MRELIENGNPFFIRGSLLSKHQITAKFIFNLISWSFHGTAVCILQQTPNDSIFYLKSSHGLYHGKAASIHFSKSDIPDLQPTSVPWITHLPHHKSQHPDQPSSKHHQSCPVNTEIPITYRKDEVSLPCPRHISLRSSLIAARCPICTLLHTHYTYLFRTYSHFHNPIIKLNYNN